MAATSSAAALVVPAVKPHTATVIFCHGLGDSGAGWMPVAQNWRMRGKLEHVKFIFPNAPMIPITANGGMVMPGWYDIKGFGDLAGKAQDEAGIVKTRDYLVDLMKKETEATGVPSSRMVLGGFSQGGSISLFTGITCKEKLGGVVGLSSYLLMAEKVKDMLADGGPNSGTPFFMGHGDSDPLVKYQWGQMTARLITEFGFKVDFRTYEGLEHSADPKEIDHLEEFITTQLPPQGEAASKA